MIIHLVCMEGVEWTVPIEAWTTAVAARSVAARLNAGKDHNKINRAYLHLVGQSEFRVTQVNLRGQTPLTWLREL